MSISRIKQIKRILQDDVRDPRATIKAIAEVVNQPRPEKPDAVLQLSLIRTGKSTMECIIKTDPEQLLPRHVITAIEMLNQFGSEKFGNGEECDDPDCPVHGKAAATTLDELFKKFEAEQLSKLAAKKGNLQ